MMNSAEPACRLPVVLRQHLWVPNLDQSAFEILSYLLKIARCLSELGLNCWLVDQ
jgi:hypothetical protein